MLPQSPEEIGARNAAMPLMTVLISWSIFHTPTGPRRLFGVGVGLVGILLYVASLWFAGIIQGLMLNETDPTGTRLINEFVQKMLPLFMNLRHCQRCFGIGGSADEPHT